MATASAARNELSDIDDIYAVTGVGICPEIPRLCGATLVRHFMQRRIRAAFDALAARESRLRNLVVRPSLARQPDLRQERGRASC